MNDRALFRGSGVTPAAPPTAIVKSQSGIGTVYTGDALRDGDLFGVCAVNGRQTDVLCTQVVPPLKHCTVILIVRQVQTDGWIGTKS